MDQPPAVALTAFADAWPRAIETEIGAALCAIGRRKDFDFDFDIPNPLIIIANVCENSQLPLLPQ